MILPVGTKVKFLHSPEEGVVMEIIDERMVSVYVSAWDMDIPVAIDDLMVTDPSLLPGYKPGKKKKEQAAIPAPPPPVTPRPVVDAPVKGIRRGTNTGTGISLAFDPVLKSDATPEKYRVLLLNDMDFDIIYSLDFFVLDERRFSKNGKLSSCNWIDLGAIAFDDLNDFPLAEVECWRITTDGTAGQHYRELRIKPKNFFVRLMEAPLLGRPMHVFSLFEQLTDGRKKNADEDLVTYTQRKAPPAAMLQIAEEERTPHEVREAAEFLPELDLHIEKLVDNPAQLTNGQILQLQMRVFEEYIDKAIRFGFDRVFIIHGLGKGRLRDAIASRLIRMPEVLTFKNEFHPRYGHGATEVIFI